MENKLEQLLNSLIEKGWKPFWKSNRWNVTIDKTIKTKSPFFDFDYHNMSVSTRELLSINSGLWQFVCENELQKTTDWEYERWLKKTSDCRWDSDEYDTKHDSWYEYRLIESALKDESELESFILDNIKVWNI